MKTFLLLITLLNYSYFTFCCEYKNETDGSNMLCPVNWFRRKRSYTRWGAEEQTTEFIVKVLDDDPTTKSSRNVAAINIQSDTRKAANIIVGAPVPSSSENQDSILFPTTKVSNNHMYLAHVSDILSNKLNQLHPKASNPERDESPPSGPQFLPNTGFSRQFAPVSSIAYRKPLSTVKETPSDFEDFIFKITYKYDEKIKSLGEKSESNLFDSDQSLLKNSVDVASDEFIEKKVTIPRPTHTTPYFVQRTPVFRKYDHLYEIVPTPSQKFLQFQEEDIKSMNDKETHSYNQWFYSEDDFYHEDVKVKNEMKNEKTYQKEDKDTKIVKVQESTTEEMREYEYDEDITTGIHNTTVSAPIRKSLNEEFDQTTFSSLFSEYEQKNESQKCNMIKLRPLSFNSPRTLPEILAQLRKWAEESPVAKWVDITNNNLTSMENSIYMMIVDDPSSGQVATAKRTVLIVAGIQGRDHHAVTAAMYVLYQLIERTRSHADLLTKYRFWIIPVFNPDGYEYSITFPHKREWSKNLRQTWQDCRGRKYCEACDLYGLRCSPQICYGVHLDRNFEYQWIPNEELRTALTCGGLYAGPRQLSEFETIALTEFLHRKHAKIYTFIAFKEGEVLPLYHACGETPVTVSTFCQLPMLNRTGGKAVAALNGPRCVTSLDGIMYPYSHTSKRRARDHEYRHRAARAAAAAYSISGRPYVAGQTSEFLPLYAGGIEDWMESHLGIDNTYSIMLYRPSDSYNTKLNTERVVHEAYAAMDTLLIQSTRTVTSPPPAVKFVRVRQEGAAASKAPRLTMSSYLIAVTSIVVYYVHIAGYLL